MKKQLNLGTLEWSLCGWTPYVWRQQLSFESGVSLNAEVTAIPARVPGSVQGALRDAGVLPDWNVGLNARQYEWVENRHWIYTAHLPDAWLQGDGTIRLRALGLDYKGWILVNGKAVMQFTGTLVPHVVDLTPHIHARNNVLQIVFDSPPRWLGQIGYTSQMKEWKPRFNYFWDWTSRLVQAGIWDDLILEVSDGNEIEALDCRTEMLHGRGELHLRATVTGPEVEGIRLELTQGERTLCTEVVTVSEFEKGISWTDLPVDPWWPNGEGSQPLYDLHCTLLDHNGAEMDVASLRLGFKAVRWLPCNGAPEGADPWICEVNGRPIFLQGVNWTPIRPNFADLTGDDYRRLIETYRDLGCNVLRVWGGAFLEKEVFYNLCDEMGLLVWQEFPLSSSGLDNWPPDDPDSIEQLEHIASTYVRRRKQHASLLMWSGGNELQGPPDGPSKPVDTTHPTIARLAEVVAELDPGRRFVPTSSSGPTFSADEDNFGKGLHWDVHGPWHITGEIDGEYARYWQRDDALFRSEVGVAGASSAEIIRAYKGELPEVPGTKDNPLWRRSSWWIDWPSFVQAHNREPARLEEFVAWSQGRQSQALFIAANACKSRFPRCGGFILWMGHDSFPCTANTSIVDFYGELKPAALSVAAVFRAQSVSIAE